MSDAVTTGATRLAAATLSHPGRVRSGNEDRAFVDADRGIFLVVDGVGGHAAGEVAAAIAVDVIRQRLERPIGTPGQRVREAIALANNEIFRQAERSPAHAGMTCVLTLALVLDDRLTVGHVGDTRLYLLSAAGLHKLTHDHSPVGEREDAGEITEAQAMAHPRRHEVFRDVGSAFREPDDPEFIELTETTLDRDAAILLCSDGLTDLVTAEQISAAVLANAGDPDRVAEALVDAANAAGGKDNVTVVYAEAPTFAGAIRRTRPGTAPPARRGGSARAAWLGIGLLIGFLAGLVANEWLPIDAYLPSARPRTLVVGPGPASPFPTIQAAMSGARAGDVVQVEPGDYVEALTVKDGVDLVARLPGTVTLVAPSGYLGWTSITVNGRLNTRIAGLRILGRGDAPISVGLLLAGQHVVVDDVTVEGVVLWGAEVVNGGTVTIRASQFVDVQGVPLRVGAGAQPLIQQNVFVRTTSRHLAPAIDVAATGAPRVAANVFSGYQNAVHWPDGGSEVMRDNFLLRGPHGR